MDDQDVVEVPAGEPDDDTPGVKSFGDEDISPEASNLVHVLRGSERGDKVLKSIGRMVIDDKFRPDWDNSEEYRRNFTEMWQMFMGKMRPKDMPMKGAAQVNLPILSQNILRIGTRMLREVFGDFSNVFGVRTTGSMVEMMANGLTVHGNRQFRHDIEGFDREMEAGALLFLMPGHVVGYSYYDPDSRQNCHEVLMPDEYAIPYTAKDRTRDLRKTPHISHIMHMYRHELAARAGEWDEDAVEKLLAREPSFDDEPRGQHGEDVALQQGIARPSGIESAAPYMIIHYEGWDDGLLPGQSRDRYIRAYVDYESREVLGLTIHEAAHWKERERFNSQVAEAEAYDEGLAQYEAARETYNPLAPPVDPATGAPLPPPTPPPRPPWASQVEDDDIVVPPPMHYQPIRMFSQGVCIENIGTSFGIGFGQIQLDLNKAANMAYDAVIDAATVSNAKPRLAARDLGLEDDFVIEIGKIKTVDCSPEELKNAILSLDPGPPNPQLAEVPFKCIELAQASMSAPDIFSGQEGKSGETWRGMASRIEQATAQLSYFGRKFAMWVEQLIYNNAYLNSLYMEERELVDFSGQTGVEVRREWYQRNYAIDFRSDLTFTPRQQRISEADEVAKIVLDIPDFLQNPAIRYEALKGVFEARGKPEFVRLMGGPPPPPREFTGPPMPLSQPGQQPPAAGAS